MLTAYLVLTRKFDVFSAPDRGHAYFGTAIIAGIEAAFEIVGLCALLGVLS